MSTFKITFLSLIALFIGLSAKAQKVELGGGLGPTFYKGDLNPRFGLLSPGVAGDIFLRYNIDRVTSLRLNAMFGNVSGKDSRSNNDYQRQRDFAFNHLLSDVSLQLEYNFLDFRSRYSHLDSDWTPYLFGGIGISKSIKSQYYAKHTELEVQNVPSGLILPFGVGVKKHLRPRLNLSVEFSTKAWLDKTYGRTFDGLDGKNQVNFYAQALGIPNTDTYYWGNTQQKDKYFHLSVTLSYLIYKVECNTNGKKFSFF